MCIICVSWNKNELNFPEAWRNYYELVRSGDLEEEHAKEVKEWLERFTGASIPQRPTMPKIPQ